MSLTQERMDWLDEHPARHSGGWIESFGFAETRSRPKRKRFPRLEARKRRLALLEWSMTKENR
jgi:hypothetical protein